MQRTKDITSSHFYICSRNAKRPETSNSLRNQWPATSRHMHEFVESRKCRCRFDSSKTGARENQAELVSVFLCSFLFCPAFPFASPPLPRIPSCDFSSLQRDRAEPLLPCPLPTADLRTVDSVLVSMAPACNLAIAEFFFGMRANPLQLRDAVNRVDCETEPVGLVVNCQFHWRVDVALLFVTAHMQVSVVRAAVGEAVNQPGIAVEVKDDRLVRRKQRIEVRIRQAMWMFCARLQLEQINHVDESDLQVGEIVPSAVPSRPALPVLGYRPPQQTQHRVQ